MADQNFDLKAFSDAIARLVANAAPSVVSVHSHRSRASGFVWRDGLIVTADETLAEEGDISVGFADGQNHDDSTAFSTDIHRPVEWLVARWEMTRNVSNSDCARRSNRK